MMILMAYMPKNDLLGGGGGGAGKKKAKLDLLYLTNNYKNILFSIQYW
jgi:hypothetical protein